MLLIITDGIISDMERTKEAIVRVIFSIWNKVLNIGLSNFCRRQPLKSLKEYGLLKQTISSNFLKAVFHKISLVYS